MRVIRHNFRVCRPSGDHDRRRRQLSATYLMFISLTRGTSGLLLSGGWVFEFSNSRQACF